MDSVCACTLYACVVQVLHVWHVCTAWAQRAHTGDVVCVVYTRGLRARRWLCALRTCWCAQCGCYPCCVRARTPCVCAARVLPTLQVCTDRARCAHAVGVCLYVVYTLLCAAQVLCALSTCMHGVGGRGVGVVHVVRVHVRCVCAAGVGYVVPACVLRLVCAVQGCACTSRGCCACCGGVRAGCACAQRGCCTHCVRVRPVRGAPVRTPAASHTLHARTCRAVHRLSPHRLGGWVGRWVSARPPPPAAPPLFRLYTCATVACVTPTCGPRGVPSPSRTLGERGDTSVTRVRLCASPT